MASILKAGLLSMQVCVPSTWTDDETVAWAEREQPCGTTLKWQIARDGDSCLGGDPARVTCADDPEMVHVVLMA